MKFLQSTGLLPTADELAGLTDDQNMAILESLFLTVIVDGKVEPNEVKAFAASALTYPWSWGTSADTIKAKLDTLAGNLKAISPDGMKDHLRAIGERIPTPVLREKTFAGMFALMIADGKLDDKEKTAAIGFANVFGLAQPRAVEIIQQVMAALLAAMGKPKE
jgi:uncharacterized tellurite resistance protein B-like protein